MHFQPFHNAPLAGLFPSAAIFLRAAVRAGGISRNKDADGAFKCGNAAFKDRPMFSRFTPKIEFVCDPDDYGVIAEPVPAKTVLPDWFRRLPAVDSAHVTASDNGLTIKRCMPFLDAMTTGWIIPLAATVRLERSGITDRRSTWAGRSTA
jgi:hypothetical protein